MKIFISQPMRNLTDDQILRARENAIHRIKKMYPGKKIDVIDSYIQGAPSNGKPLWYLGESLKMLSTADLAVFIPGWSEAFGCQVEHTCAVGYNIDVMELWPQDNVIDNQIKMDV